MSRKSISWHKMPISRRRFVQATSITGATAVTGFPQILWAQGKKILKTRAYGPFTTADPAFSIGVVDEEIHGLIYSKLVHYKPGAEWGWQLQLAESIEQVDPTHISFKLKPGMTFSNGYGDITAEDVKFSFERVIDDDVKSSLKPDWGSLSHVDVTDELSGVIVFKEPYAAAWSIALPYSVGNIVSKKAISEAGGRLQTDVPTESGPYRIKEWREKQATILERNPDWKGAQESDFDEIHILQIDDEKTAEIGFEAGDIDFTRVSMTSLANLEANPPANSTVKNHPSLYYAWVGMNLDNPKMTNKDFRQAIQYAIDVDSVVEAAYFGAAEPSTGIIAPGLPGHRAQGMVPASGNMAKAKELLAKSGITGDGLKLGIEVLNKSTNVTAAQVIQANLAELGIELEVNMNESGAFWSIGDESKGGDRWKNWNLILNRYSMTPDPYYATAWFIQDQVGVWNWERFRNQEFDDLHKAAAAETDVSKRDMMYKRAQDLMEESGAYRFLTHEATPMMWRNTIVPALRPDGLPLYRYFKSA